MASGGTLIRTQHFNAPANAPAYLQDMLKEIGLQEWVHDAKGKKKSNPTVQKLVARAMRARPGSVEEEKLLKTNTLTTPWCAYYINGHLEKCGIPGTASGMARSFNTWGLKVWAKGDPWPENIPVGSICTMWRGPRDDGVTGHVFSYLYHDGNYVYGLGGNQGDSVSIQRFAKHKLLHIRKARPLSDSKTVKAGGGIAGNEAVVKPLVESLPDSAANSTGGLDGMMSAIESARSPLEALGAVKPALQLLCTLITVALAAYVIYCRYKAWKNGG
ncbi:MAG: hypothetical protein AB7Q00_14435 [Phycisphaerales bacterium]